MLVTIDNLLILSVRSPCLSVKYSVFDNISFSLCWGCTGILTTQVTVSVIYWHFRHLFIYLLQANVCLSGPIHTLIIFSKHLGLCWIQS